MREMHLLVLDQQVTPRGTSVRTIDIERHEVVTRDRLLGPVRLHPLDQPQIIEVETTMLLDVLIPRMQHEDLADPAKVRCAPIGRPVIRSGSQAEVR